jgi:hypothetical protein
MAARRYPNLKRLFLRNLIEARLPASIIVCYDRY